MTACWATANGRMCVRRTCRGELDWLDASYRDVVASGGQGSLVHVREDAGDRRPPPPLALGGHPAPVRLDEMLHDGEAQPRAAFIPRARGIGPVEALEDARQVLARDARAVVP